MNEKRNCEKEERKARAIMKRSRAYVACGLPADTDCSIPKVSMTGDRYVRVEHHEGVLLISERAIRLHTSLGILRIEGSGLCAAALNGEELLANGRIRSVSFE